MRAWLCFALVLGALVPVGCGGVGASPPGPQTAAVTPEPATAATPRPPTSPPAAANIAPPGGANHAILVALVPGSVPQTVAARILGRPAYIQPAWRGGANPPLPRPGSRGAYVIPVVPSEEQWALSRARADKEVMSAQLVAWPPDLP
jgi:hypothetical protein